MNMETVVGIAFRWLHLFGAIAAAGGALFALVVLHPAMRQLPEEARTKLKEVARPRFAKLIMVAITALLASGIYNYLIVLRPRHVDQPEYHALMGVKILLALAMFFIASGLTGSSPAFAKMRAKSGVWLTLNVLLAFVVVLIGAILRTMPVQATS